jgi:hypothetical protein
MNISNEISATERALTGRRGTAEASVLVHE